MPRKVFTAGEVLTSADVNEYLMDQTIMTFAGTAARGSAIGTASAKEGMVTYLADTDTFEFWDGSSYQTFGGPDLLVVEALVISGGGGGGTGAALSRGAGGGGAGGYFSFVSGETSGGTAVADSQVFLTSGTAGSYAVQIGGGGATPLGRGTSSFFTQISPVGGGPGGSNQTDGVIGASGGGAAQAGSNLVGGSPFPQQGFKGGDVTGDNQNGGAGAGGGGAGAAAPNVGANANTGGAGGAGLASSITGSSVTRAVGGNGGNKSGTVGTAGGANTGNGGGGGGGGNNAGGAGGSGVVILRYPATYTITIGAGLTGSTATDGDYKVTTITAGTGNVSWA
jgi:hypothetical protein